MFIDFSCPGTFTPLQVVHCANGSQSRETDRWPGVFSFTAVSFSVFVFFVSHRMLLFWPYSPGPVPLHTIGVYVSQPSFNWLLLCWVLPFSVGSTRVTLLLGFLWRQGSRLATAGHFLLCYHRLRFLFLDQCFFPRFASLLLEVQSNCVLWLLISTHHKKGLGSTTRDCHDRSETRFEHKDAWF